MPTFSDPTVSEQLSFSDSDGARPYVTVRGVAYRVLAGGLSLLSSFWLLALLLWKTDGIMLLTVAGFVPPICAIIDTMTSPSFGDLGTYNIPFENPEATRSLTAE